MFFLVFVCICFFFLFLLADVFCCLLLISARVVVVIPELSLVGPVVWVLLPPARCWTVRLPLLRYLLLAPPCWQFSLSRILGMLLFARHSSAPIRRPMLLLTSLTISLDSMMLAWFCLVLCWLPSIEGWRCQFLLLDCSTWSGLILM